MKTISASFEATIANTGNMLEELFYGGMNKNPDVTIIPKGVRGMSSKNRRIKRKLFKRHAKVYKNCTLVLNKQAQE